MTRAGRIYSFLVAVLSTPRILCAGPLDEWTWRSPWAVPASLYGIAYGGGQFVTVGSGGTVLTSTDGISWIERESRTTNWISHIAYGNGQFVAAVEVWNPELDLNLLTSSNGVEWAEHDLGRSGEVDSLTFGGSRFVALAGSWDGTTSERHQLVETSTDGAIWIESDLGQAGLLDVVYGNGQFVAVGSKGTILTSTDGSHWVVELSGTTNDLAHIAFGGGQYLALGWPDFNSDTRQFEFTVLASTNGVDWTQHRSASQTYPSHLGYDGREFILVGGGVLTSLDGMNWVEQSVSDVYLEDLVQGEGLTVVVGDRGMTFASSDGVNWQPRDDVTSSRLGAIVYGNGRFVAVGDAILTSADGVTWMRQAEVSNTLTAVTFGNGQFVAVGPVGKGTESNSNYFLYSLGILISSNGLEWSSYSAGSNMDYAPADGLAFGNARFVAVGGETILGSSDGRQWAEAQWLRPGSQLAPKTVAFGHGRFVVMGGYGAFLTSTNGLDWIELPLGSEAWFESITYGNNRFVALGSTDPAAIEPGIPTYVIATSIDGLNWTIYPTAATHGNNPTFSIAYGNGQFVALAGRTILTSRDGTTWTMRTPTSSRLAPWGDLVPYPSAVAYGDGHFVAVGGLGTIIQSGDVISLRLQSASSGGKPVLSLEGPTGSHYTVQISTNLNSWSDWTNFSSTQPTTVLGDVPAPPASPSFYRATARY